MNNWAWACALATLLCLPWACDTTGTRRAALSSQRASSQGALERRHKLSPLLSLWLQKDPGQRRALEAFSTWRRAQGQRQLRLLFSYRGPGAALRGLGIEPEVQSGPIHVAWVSLSRLQELVQLPGLEEVALSRKLRPHLNVSTPLVFAPQGRHQHGADGRGTIVGIIDTGIDVFHPAFQTPQGKTRVMAILDFSLAATSGDKQPPRVFTAAQINKALEGKQPFAHKDQVGHGTHVAGIAAGNGQSTAPSKGVRYMGVAPRADLMVVKGVRKGNTHFDSGDVLRGIQFIHEIARYLNRPYVINLSLGGHHGGHDGHSLLERGVSAYSGAKKSGRAIVASAGNEGNASLHASGWIQGDNGLSLRLDLPRTTLEGGSPQDARLQMELWTPLESKMSFAIETPDGTVTEYFPPRFSPKAPILTPSGRISLGYQERSQPIPSHRYVILLSNVDREPLRHGHWKLRLKGPTPRFDLWISETTFPPGTRAASIVDLRSQELLIGVPASTAAVLTVGAFNSRSGWANVKGAVVERPYKIGELADFSSPGPTRDQRAKPEVVAPGLYIAAPAPLDADKGNGTVADGPFQLSQGTSQAAPHLTGGIALMLQLRPGLDVEQIRQLLIRNAYSDAHTQQGALYQGSWGHGKLDLLRSLNMLQWGSSKLSVHPRRSTLGSVRADLPANGAAKTSILVLPKDEAGRGLRGEHEVQLQTTAGTLSAVSAVSPGIYVATLTADDAPGVATLTAKVDGVALEATAQVEFLPSSHLQRQGCGCHSTKPEHHVPAFALLLILGLWLRKPSPRP